MSLITSEIPYLLNAPITLMTEDELEESFIRVIALLKAFPSAKATFKCTLEGVLVLWGRHLERGGHYDKLFSSYKEGLSVYFDHEGLLSNLGAFLMRTGHSEEACECFQEALKINPNHIPALRNLESFKNMCVERWHFRMLNDRVRNNRFREAIIKKVRQGSTCVLDIGTGTGILSLFALEGGAKEIYACDVSKVMIEIAEQVFDRNHASSKIKLIHKLSNDLVIPEDIPERVQLVFTETVDDGLFGENILQTLLHAWDSLLLPCPVNVERNSNRKTKSKPQTGCVIPQSAHVWVAAIECSYVDLKYRTLACTEKKLPSEENACRDVLGLNFFAFDGNEYDSLDLNNIPGGYRFLSQPTIGMKVNFNDRNKIENLLNGMSEEITVSCLSQGRVDGFAMWFDLNLDEEIKLSSGPLDHANRAKCWDQAIFPIQLPIFAVENNRLNLKLSCEGGRMSIKLCSVNKSDNNNPSTSLASYEPLSHENAPSNSRIVPESIQSLPNIKSYPVTYEIISFLNDKCWLDSLNDALKLYTQTDNGKNCVSLLDLSPFPVFGLAFLVNQLKEFGQCHSTLTCVAFEEQDKAAILLVARANNIGAEFIEILNGKLDDALIPTPEFDLILLHPIEMSGKMYEKYLTYLPLLSQVMRPSGILLPREITVCCQMVFCDWLFEVSEVQGNDRVCGYNIASFINEYKVSEHLHYGVSTPEFDAYSEEVETQPIPMERFVTNVAEPVKFKAFCTVKNDGFVNALPYWYKIGISYNSANVPTNSWRSYANQAVVLISPPLEVSAGESMCITFTCNQGLMNATIEREV